MTMLMVLARTSTWYCPITFVTETSSLIGGVQERPKYTCHGMSFSSCQFLITLLTEGVVRMHIVQFRLAFFTFMGFDCSKKASTVLTSCMKQAAVGNF